MKQRRDQSFDLNKNSDSSVNQNNRLNPASNEIVYSTDIQSISILDIEIPDRLIVDYFRVTKNQLITKSPIRSFTDITIKIQLLSQKPPWTYGLWVSWL